MISKQDKYFLEKLIKKFDRDNQTKEKKYPLLEKGFTSNDIMRGIEVLLSRKITMSNLTKKFEKEFSKFIGSKYALMVNSGSSANLLASFALINPLKKNKLRPGDKFIIPTTCWSTSLWPLVQCGLKPKFIDINPDTFCLNEELLKKKEFRNSKAIMNIHILGNSPDIEKIAKFAKDNKMFLIEDTCEALGSMFKSKFLGTYGDFGTYSFYYSHQITSGEGGMVICKTKEDYELLHTLRAHGWDRGIKSNKRNNNFNFINSGFNLRPLDLTAAIGLSQLKRLKNMMKIRKLNRNSIIKKLKLSKNWKNQFSFFEPNNWLKPSWFGLPILISPEYVKNKQKFMNYLNAQGIETRPILSGNFLNQPSAKLYKFNINKNKYKVSQDVEDRGFFIGLPTKPISNDTLNFLSVNLLNIDNC